LLFDGRRAHIFQKSCRRRFWNTSWRRRRRRRNALYPAWRRRRRRRRRTALYPTRRRTIAALRGHTGTAATQGPWLGLLPLLGHRGTDLIIRALIKGAFIMRALITI
jgi:hypothetical protein